MQKNLESNPTTYQQLYLNLQAVGHNSIFGGAVDDAAGNYSQGVRNLIFYLENSSEFNDRQDAGHRESVLQEGQGVDRAILGLEEEVTRSTAAIDVLRVEMNRRNGK